MEIYNNVVCCDIFRPRLDVEDSILAIVMWRQCMVYLDPPHPSIRKIDFVYMHSLYTSVWMLDKLTITNERGGFYHPELNVSFLLGSQSSAQFIFEHVTFTYWEIWWTFPLEYPQGVVETTET